MATYKAIVFPGKNHVKSDGTTNIKIRIYHNSTSQYIPTNYYIKPEQINDSGSISGINSELLNYEIGSIIQKYRAIELKIGIEKVKRINCSELKELILKMSEIDYEYIDFIAFSRNLIAETQKTKTADWYKTSLNSFLWFIKKDKIDARDINVKLIERYVSQIKISAQSGAPLEPGAISNYLRGLRALYNKCKSFYNNDDHGIIRIINNPFTKGLVPQYRRAKKNLLIDSIIKIRDFEATKKRQDLAKDVFMTMFYLMGININDLYNITSITRDNRINYKRSKTNTDDNILNYPLSIRVEPELHAILNKYSEGGMLSYIKLRYKNSYNFMKAVNKGLDEITLELKLPKVTTNWARHSWASIARNKAKISKPDIDFCLGHVNNDYKMADIYIEIDYSIFDECNRKVLDLLKSK